MKNPVLKYICFTLILCLAFPVVGLASGIDVTEVTSLSVNKVIKGDISDILITIPTSWKNDISIERVSPQKGASYIEKYNIYYKPTDDKISRISIVTILVYTNEAFKSESSQTKFLSTSTYTVSLSVIEKNPLEFGSDKVVLDKLLKEANDDYFMKSVIAFESNPVSTNTVYVNGKALKTSAYSNTSSKVVYIPIREACEALGYEVGWSDKDQAITISNGDFSNQLVFGQVNKKYHVIKRNGITYVSTAYFLQVLKCTVEVDPKNNVKIVK